MSALYRFARDQSVREAFLEIRRQASEGTNESVKTMAKEMSFSLDRAVWQGLDRTRRERQVLEDPLSDLEQAVQAVREAEHGLTACIAAAEPRRSGKLKRSSRKRIEAALIDLLIAVGRLQYSHGLVLRVCEEESITEAGVSDLSPTFVMVRKDLAEYLLVDRDDIEAIGDIAASRRQGR